MNVKRPKGVPEGCWRRGLKWVRSHKHEIWVDDRQGIAILIAYGAQKRRGSRYRKQQRRQDVHRSL